MIPLSVLLIMMAGYWMPARFSGIMMSMIILLLLLLSSLSLILLLAALSKFVFPDQQPRSLVSAALSEFLMPHAPQLILPMLFVLASTRHPQPGSAAKMNQCHGTNAIEMAAVMLWMCLWTLTLMVLESLT
jgi:hypothetical protein